MLKRPDNSEICRMANGSNSANADFGTLRKLRRRHATYLLFRLGCTRTPAYCSGDRELPALRGPAQYPRFYGG